MASPRCKWTLAAILTLALAVRLAAIWKSGLSACHFGDAPDYLEAARSICSTGSYPVTSSLPFFRAPGLPFFIATATACHPGLIWLVKFCLCACDLASVTLIMLMAAHLFSFRAAIISGLLAALYPFFIFQATDIQTEPLFMCLYLAAILLVLKASSSSDWHLACFAGMCASAAALVRPAGLLLLPLLALLALGAQPAWKITAIFAASALACLSPWTIRNELRFHELMPVNDAAGYNFWRGTSPEMAGIDRMDAPSAFQAASWRFENITSPAMARRVEAEAASPGARSALWFRYGLRNLNAPVLLRNAAAFWRPWVRVGTRSNAIVIGSGALVSGLYALAIAGWRRLIQRHRGTAGWLVLAAISFWIAQIPFQVTTRFRVPIEDPLLMVLAGGAVSGLRWRIPSGPHSLLRGLHYHSQAAGSMRWRKT